MCFAQSHNLKAFSACKYVKKPKFISVEGLGGCAACDNELKLETKAKQAEDIKNLAAAKLKFDREKVAKAKLFAAAQEKKRIENSKTGKVLEITNVPRPTPSKDKSNQVAKKDDPKKLIQFYDYSLKRFGMKSETGKVIFEPKYVEILNLADEKSQFYMATDDKGYFVDENGKTVMEIGPFEAAPKLVRYYNANRYYLEYTVEKKEVCVFTFYLRRKALIVDGKVSVTTKELHINNFNYNEMEFDKYTLRQQSTFDEEVDCLKEASELRKEIVAQGYIEKFIYTE